MSNNDSSAADRGSGFSAGLDMAVCTYDNPRTMMRECWQDGVLQAAYAAELYALREWPLRNYGYIYHFGANLMGDWKTGQMVGDARAMSNVAIKPPVLRSA